ncbi:MAG: RNA-directed DNA polymerase [Candidatus Gastranaerophilales bacterium]
MNKNILNLNYNEAKEFFLKAENYCNIDLPTYFNFQPLLNELTKEMNDNYDASKSSTQENVNYVIYNNKDGCYAWRPLELINPILYVKLVNLITEKKNWEVIKNRFIEFQSNELIQSKAIPALKTKKQKQRASQITTWWREVEQHSLTLSLEYSYLYTTDITDCYGAIYTHSIAWALHEKEFAKEKRKNKEILGNRIDQTIRSMRNGQTNGIPQGSTLMDFIAEMVLGYADLLLSKKLNHLNSKNYKIIRYRDDYRIFVNDSQIGNYIIKCVTEVMIELGLKLNASKTAQTNDIIAGAIKEDKLYCFSHLEELNSKCHNLGNLQKQLMRIYDFSKRFPNSGTLQKLLHQYFKKIKFKKNDRSIEPIISIVFSIAYNNPRIYPTASAIIAKALSHITDFNKRYNIIKKIGNRIKEKPNTEYMEIWLQRIAYNDDSFREYGSNICKLVSNEYTGSIWNIGWANKNLKSIFNEYSIIDKGILSNLDSEIRDDEINIFSYDD